MRIVHLLLLSMLGFMLLAACSRYEEGPSFSIWPAKDRIVNIWKWSLAVENGVNRTGELADSTIEFRDDEIVRICDLSDNCREGSWNLVTKKQKLQLIFGQKATAYEIRLLKKSEMWLSFSDSDSIVRVEWELVSGN